ncbi:hypothetical protein [Bernardetia sp.]|uniref:hypothetical protein n=1 Tax=Bernardetia sp. TaxID=1937974 RepID=UPI0025BE7425|nr:hypothetical protein [Bernardetia sp.]
MKNPILSENHNLSSILKENNFQELQNMIVRYVYKETSSIENTDIESLLQSNEKLKQFFYEVVNLKKQMDDCQTRHKPSNNVIEKILSYSKN